MLIREIKIDNKEIFLVGTAHVSRKSEELVREAIEKYNPDCVGVELDSSRLMQLKSGEKWHDTNVMEIMKNGQAYLFLISLMLSNFQRKIGEQVGTKIGSDMLSAVNAAEEKNIRLLLLDRDVRVTMKRAFSKTKLLEKAKLLNSIFLMMFGVGGEKITEEKIERLKEKDIMSELIGQFSREFPSLKEVLVDERDLYIADKILRSGCKRIVAVVGAGHLDGIEKNIMAGKKAVGLDHVPKKTDYLKFAKYLVPALFVALIAWLFMAKGLNIGIAAIIAWFLTTGLLSALGVLIAREHPLSILTAFLAAPFTTLHPLLAAGWFAALAEAKFRAPKVRDIEALPNIESYSDLVKNNATRIIMVGAFANIGATIGTLVAFPYIAALLL